MLKVVMQLNRLLETKQKIYFVISFIFRYFGVLFKYGVFWGGYWLKK